MRITELLLYPVKSCGGISVPQLRLDRRGPAGDRRFMVVDEAGKFITQRREPRMVWVEASLRGNDLVLSTGDRTTAVPREPVDGTRADVQVWGDVVSAVEVDAGSAFFSEHLGRRVRLVYMPEESLRPVEATRGRPGDVVSFADAYPLLLVGEESLDELNGRLGAPLPMSRFRPNVVIAGGGAHDEDALGEFRLGELTFRNVKPCERCLMTTVDPATAEYGEEPLRTLATYRKRGGHVLFGTNLIHDGEGLLSVGDTLTPL